MSCQMIIPFEFSIAKMTLKNIVVLFFPLFIKWPLDVIVLTTPTCNMYAICRSSSRTFFCSVISASPKNRVLLFLIRYKNKPIFVQKQWVSFVTFDKPCYLWLNRIWNLCLNRIWKQDLKKSKNCKIKKYKNLVNNVWVALFSN